MWSCSFFFHYFEYLTIFKFWGIFLFLDSGGFVVKLLASKVICQHMFFFTLSYFLLTWAESSSELFLSPVVCPSVCPFVNFSYFRLHLDKYEIAKSTFSITTGPVITNVAQIFLGVGDWSLFKKRSLFQEEIIMK